MHDTNLGGVYSAAKCIENFCEFEIRSCSKVQKDSAGKVTYFSLLLEKTWAVC